MTEPRETTGQFGQAQYGEPRRDLIEAARRGDLTGMNFAILARLSNESRRRRHLKDSDTDDRTAKSDPKTGLDINNRDEQVLQCTRRIESRGGKVVHVYDEEHTSAWKRRRVTLDDGSIGRRVKRPVYKQTLTDLVKGTVAGTGVRLDGLMLADVDRLTRDNRDLEDGIDAIDMSGRPILDRRGALDLLSESGRTMARVIVAFKAGQSADTAQRVKDKHVALQREGIPSGGNRPFGWNEDKRTLHPAESKLLQAAVADILGGKSMTSVSARWNKAGIRTARGKKWRAEILKAVLRNPRMAGYRMVTVHNADSDTGTRTRYVITARDEDGNPVIGQWTRMISPEDWDKLTAIIGEKPGRGDGGNTRKHLLTGTLRCGKDGCDMLLRATKAPANYGKPEGYFWYTCPPKSAGGCGGVKITGGDTDTAVIKIVIEKYEAEAADREAAAEPVPWGGEEELGEVLADIAAAKASRQARTITAERYYADLAGFEADERRLLKDRNAHIKATAVQADMPVTLREDWLAGRLTLTEQRVYIERALSAVIVHPASGRGNGVHNRIEEVPA